MRTLFLSLLMLSLSIPMLAQQPGPPPQKRFHSVDTTGRFGPITADSLRVRNEFDLLRQRLKLDSAQTEYVRNVLDRRNRLLKSQRQEPIKDKMVLDLRIKKVISEADRDIEKKLNPEQLEEYRKYLRERDEKTAKEGMDTRRGKHPPRGPGGPGPGGTGGGPVGLGDW